MAEMYFETPPYREHVIRAEDGGDDNARITILHDGRIVRQYLVLAYRVWNTAAHAEEIIDELIDFSSPDEKTEATS